MNQMLDIWRASRIDSAQNTTRGRENLHCSVTRSTLNRNISDIFCANKGDYKMHNLWSEVLQSGYKIAYATATTYAVCYFSLIFFYILPGPNGRSSTFRSLGYMHIWHY